MRSVRRRSSWIPVGCALGCLLLAACAGGVGPPRSLAPLWRDYEKMPAERALAIAGDPARRWVGAASGGYPTREMAEESVVAECMRRRSARRMQQPCRLYAVGDEIVW
jgi:hypothetical protein